MRVEVQQDAEGAARRAATLLVEVIDDAHERGAEAHIALSGGSTPRRAYELLAERDGPWTHVHLWLGDERCVPATHEDSSERMIRESLLHSMTGPERPVLHGARGELGPEDAAWLYALELREALGDEPVLDLALCGLGEDGHTASLFPGDPVVSAAHVPVVAVRRAPKPPPERISMTLPVLVRAGHTVLLAAGAGKREMLARVRAGDETIPAGRLAAGLDEIVCDVAAAGETATA
jgi:6-phosphogluconolactonase